LVVLCCGKEHAQPHINELVYNPAHDAAGWIILPSYEFRNILFNKALVSVVITQITYRYIVRDT
jgi:hypothetical protein